MGDDLINHLISGGEQRAWDRQSKLFGGLEIEDKRELRWLFNRQVGRFG